MKITRERRGEPQRPSELVRFETEKPHGDEPKLVGFCEHGGREYEGGGIACVHCTGEEA